ncbi:MAG: helix-hairpin-helix domain-containing protein, partial [Gemmatimonadota bacterium]|nr:helix-hairpin-helix domain-containing protein [Gemmatimonadota bacterium]
MQISSVERTALGVVALMLSLGTAARTFAPGPSAPVWQETAADSSGATLPGRVAEEAAREERRSLPLGRGERIDPNTASADELDRLPRVGPALATRIVEWRSAHGPFATLA